MPEDKIVPSLLSNDLFESQFDAHAKSLRNATVFSIQLNHHENRNKIKLTNSLDSRSILEIHTLDFYHCEAFVFNKLKYL